jgi:hypothetical protein
MPSLPPAMLLSQSSAAARSGSAIETLDSCGSGWACPVTLGVSDRLGARGHSVSCHLNNAKSELFKNTRCLETVRQRVVQQSSPKVSGKPPTEMGNRTRLLSDGLHHHELAWQATGKPSGDRATDRLLHDRYRPCGLLRDRRKSLPKRDQGYRRVSCAAACNTGHGRKRFATCCAPRLIFPWSGKDIVRKRSRLNVVQMTTDAMHFARRKRLSTWEGTGRSLAPEVASGQTRLSGSPCMSRTAVRTSSGIGPPVDPCQLASSRDIPRDALKRARCWRPGKVAG